MDPIVSNEYLILYLHTHTREASPTQQHQRGFAQEQKEKYCPGREPNISFLDPIRRVIGIFLTERCC